MLRWRIHYYFHIRPAVILLDGLLPVANHYLRLSGTSSDHTVVIVFAIMEHRNATTIQEAQTFLKDDTVQSLSLNRINLRNPNAWKLSLSWKQNNKFLKVLNLNSCMICSQGGKALGNAVEDSALSEAGAALEELYLSNNGIGPDGAAAFGSALPRTSFRGCPIRILNLNWNEIQDEGAIALARGLGECIMLEELYLSNNGIGPDGAAAFGSALPRTSFRGCPIRILNLNSNEIQDEGAIALACGLGECIMLEELLLRGNNIGDGGATALAECLTKNNALKKLDLSCNRIVSAGAVAFAEKWMSYTTISLINLRQNPVDSDIRAALGKLGNMLDPLFLQRERE